MPIVRSTDSILVATAVYVYKGKPIRFNDRPISEKDAKEMIRVLVNHIAKGCPHYGFKGRKRKE